VDAVAHLAALPNDRSARWLPS